jgi:hypothetical protein
MRQAVTREIPTDSAALSKLGCCSMAPINRFLCRVFFALRVLAVKLSSMEDSLDVRIGHCRGLCRLRRAALGGFW